MSDTSKRYYNNFYANKDWNGISLISRFKVIVFFKILSIKYDKEVNRVIDAGCGTGLYSGILNSLGFHTFGFDFSEQAIKKAKKNYSCVDFRVLDASELSYKKNSIDMFFAKGFSPFNSVESVETTKLLDYWREYLTNNGIVFLITKTNFTQKAPTGWYYLSDNQVDMIYNGDYYKKEVLYLFPSFWFIIYLLPKSEIILKVLNYISKNIIAKIFKIPVSVIIILQKNA